MSRWMESACALPLDSGVVVFSSLYGCPVVLHGSSVEGLTRTPPAEIDDSPFFRLRGEVPDRIEPEVEAHLIRRGLASMGSQQPGDERRILAGKADAYLAELDRKPMLNRLGLTLTSACNFGCNYCIRDSADADRLSDPQTRSLPLFDLRASRWSQPPGSNGRPKLAGVMSFETAKAAVVGLARNADPTEEVNIGFSGGEPLLHFSLVERVVEYAISILGDRVTFAINTNASLVTEESARFMAKHGFAASVSLDGPPGINGKARPFRRGKQETFDDIVAGIRKMRDCGVNVVGLYATIVDENREALSEEFLAIVADLGIQTLTVEPDLVHASGLDPLWLAERFSFLVLQGRSHGVGVTGYWRRAYDQLFSDVLNDPVQTFCGASSGEGLNVTPDGVLQNCGFAPYSMGDITEFDKVLLSEQFRNYVRDNYVGKIPECRGCGIEGLCQGGCGLTRKSANRTQRATVFRDHCRLYRYVTAHLLEATVRERMSLVG